MLETYVTFKRQMPNFSVKLHKTSLKGFQNKYNLTKITSKSFRKSVKPHFSDKTFKNGEATLNKSAGMPRSTELNAGDYLVST